jgi:glutaminyl-tRNA synthetase
MRAGEFSEGAHVLRARIDMASPNMKMRDPLLYRIKYGHHYRRGSDWCVYPMYDFAHPLSDALEDITHSICTLEFENNRPLYDWVVDNCRTPPRPYQYEFNRLILDYTVMSKRKLLQLVEGGLVRGWDDPRMPTIAGLRRRGVTPESITAFCERIGVDKTNSRVDMALLEYAIRDDLNFRAPRVLCVVDPIRVVIENYPEDRVEWLDAPFWPHDVPREGSRKIPFSRHLLIERDDFEEHPPPKYYRLSPGREVRLRYGYFITCQSIVRNQSGDIVELRCTYDPDTRGGDAPDGRRVRGTLHWVSEEHSIPAEVRLYDRLFTIPDPDSGDRDFREFLNPKSEVVMEGARIEPSVANDLPDERYQFERLGYFWKDPVDSTSERPVFNRIVALRDTWAKIRQQEDVPAPAGRKSPRARASQESDAGRSVGTSGAASGDVSKSARRHRGKRLSSKARAAADAYVDRHGLSAEDAGILASEKAALALFDSAVAAGAAPAAAANWIIQEVRPAAGPDGISSTGIKGPDVAAILRLLDEGALSSRTARGVLKRILREGGDPEQIAREQGLTQISDESTLEAVVDSVLRAHPDRVAAYRSGKTGLLGFFIGQVMQRTDGKANPELTRSLLDRRLQSDDRTGP